MIVYLLLILIFLGDSTILTNEMNQNFIDRDNIEKRSPMSEKKSGKSPMEHHSVRSVDAKEAAKNANQNRNNSSDHHHPAEHIHHIGRKSPQRCPSRSRPDLRVLIPPRSHTGHSVCSSNLIINVSSNLDK